MQGWYLVDVSPGLVVMGEEVQEVMGSNPSTVYWMDIFHLVNKLHKMFCLFKRPKLKKEAWDGQFLQAR